VALDRARAGREGRGVHSERGENALIQQLLERLLRRRGQGIAEQPEPDDGVAAFNQRSGE
jgi:hypothetical protein